MAAWRRYLDGAILLAVLFGPAGAFSHVHLHADLCEHQQHDQRDCPVCVLLAACLATLPLLLVLPLPLRQNSTLNPLVLAVASCSSPCYFFRRGPPAG